MKWLQYGIAILVVIAMFAVAVVLGLKAGDRDFANLLKHKKESEDAAKKHITEAAELAAKQAAEAVAKQMSQKPKGGKKS